MNLSLKVCLACASLVLSERARFVLCLVKESPAAPIGEGVDRFHSLSPEQLPELHLWMFSPVQSAEDWKINAEKVKKVIAPRM